MMPVSNVLFHDAVQLIYADARRRVEEARGANEVGEPYRLLLFALETAYPKSIANDHSPEVDAPSDFAIT